MLNTQAHTNTSEKELVFTSSYAAWSVYGSMFSISVGLSVLPLLNKALPVYAAHKGAFLYPDRMFWSVLRQRLPRIITNCLSRMCMGEGETGFMKRAAQAAMSYLGPVAEDLSVPSISDKLLRKLEKTIDNNKASTFLEHFAVSPSWFFNLSNKSFLGLIVATRSS